MTEVISGRGISLKRLFAEVGAIVMSILLAFALDAWWDAAADSREADTVLVGLNEELSSVRTVMEGILLSTASQQSGAEEVASRLREQPSGAMIADSLLAQLFTDITINPSLGSYEGLIASGRIALIEAQDLHNALASWPAILEDAVEEQRRLQRMGDDQLKPLLEVATPDLSRTYDILAEWESVKAQSPTGPGSSDVRPSTELVNLVERRIYLLKIIQAELTVAREHLDLMQRLISRERE